LTSRDKCCSRELMIRSRSPLSTHKYNHDITAKKKDAKMNEWMNRYDTIQPGGETKYDTLRKLDFLLGYRHLYIFTQYTIRTHHTHTINQSHSFHIIQKDNPRIMACFIVFWFCLLLLLDLEKLQKFCLHCTALGELEYRSGHLDEKDWQSWMDGYGDAIKPNSRWHLSKQQLIETNLLSIVTTQHDTVLQMVC